jgi:hypothetical protein
LSQRTHARTTGAGKHKQPEPGSQPAATSQQSADAGHAPDAGPAGARNTPPATRGRRAASSAAAASTPPAGPVSHALDPSSLARTLRAVADELERDPALASRIAAASGQTAAPVDTHPAAGRHDGAPTPPAPAPTAPRAARTFRPRLITGTAAELGTGIPDPFALRTRLGRDGLEAALAELRLGTLRAIIREHGLDPAGRLAHLNDAERLRALILDASGPN